MQPTAVLIVDHHDSFIYNLRQIVDETPSFEADVRSIDDLNELEALLDRYRYILLSPGPGHPDEYPMMYKLIRAAADGCHTILGVCLGMQGFWCCYGGELINMGAPKHGHCGSLTLTHPDALLFRGIEMPTPIARYHSWVADKDTLPEGWVIDGYDQDGVVMAISHSSLPFFAVQFHPESIITKEGRAMVKNWLMHGM